MIKRTVVFMLALTLVASGTLAWAAADEGRRGDRHAQRSQKFQQWLGLSDDQMTQIRAIKERDRGTHEQVGQALHKAQAELRQLALGGADEPTVQRKEAEVQQLLGQMVQQRTKSLQEIAPILTPEQREKMAQGGPRGHGRHGGRRAPSS
ncbi:MAG: Spy/CpxP family protein refolding chaperone [Candidatus Rokubacteria bacterium]|nr:Spy/CpxP family protein refolding chaperone [Candidatus Rokubacteria bacterium]